MAIVTVAYWDRPEFNWRFAFQDLSAYTGLLVGVAWAQMKGAEGVRNAFGQWYIIVCATFGLTLIALERGYFKSGGGTSRLLDGALFSSSLFLSMSLPIVWPVAKRGVLLQRTIVISGILICIAFAIMSETRSVGLALAVSLACVLMALVKKQRAHLLWIIALVIVAVGLISLDYSSVSESTTNLGLVQRFARNEVGKESRALELQMMIGQMGLPEWIHGVGFGSGFVSPIGIDLGEDNGLSLVPHIGITTLLYKGGAPVELLLLVIPCCVAALKLILTPSSPLDPFLAGVTVYLAQACISGGWGFFPLFLVGALLEIGLETGTGLDRRRQYGGLVGSEPLSRERRWRLARVRT